MKRNFSVDDFDFDLPETSIALEPARPRDSANLLHVKGDRLTDLQVNQLPSLLREGDLLVVNDTKVIPAQLVGIRSPRDHGGGGPVSVDVTLHKELTVPGETVWRAFVRPAKRVRVGDILDFGQGQLSATVRARHDAEATLVFDCPRHDFLSVLAGVGMPPLPPYIARKRVLRDSDRDDYQTRYAKIDGSVAAPTAGLHFTNSLLDQVYAKGVKRENLTLHVGAGTFLPVTVEAIEDHKMHAEWGRISQAQADHINQTRQAGGRVIAVGTTSLRLLESAATDDGQVHPFCGETDIFITPGYTFRAVDCLMTNFHLPKSTLFMLVCAFAGVDQMKAAYSHAIKTGYRFYSYGDSSLLERRDER